MVGRCEVKAYRVAMHLVRNESAAQEILQETFLSAWKNMQRLDDKSRFCNWVCRATVKAALDRLDSPKGQPRPENDNGLFPAVTNTKFWTRERRDGGADWSLRSPDQLASEDLHQHIRQTVDLLPVELRTVFLLCDLAEISVEDSAEILDLAVETARERLQAARLAVRDAIGHYFWLFVVPADRRDDRKGPESES
jgi:RNA polymerase sigma-70 factor (ECF subfamily)